MKKITCLLLGSMLILFCSHDQGTNVENGSGMTAVIYSPGGKKPAGGATISIFDAAAVGATPVAVYICDHRGRYTITGLPGGVYTLWAEKDSFVLFMDSLQITSQANPTLADDTLEYASSLTGRISIQPCHDPRSVSIQVIGSDKKFNSASGEGMVTLNGLAGGTYRLLIRSTLPEYTTSIASVNVDPGSHDTMDDPLNLTYIGIPMITKTHISQDTLNGIIGLSWEKVTDSAFQDYVVFRDVCKSFNYSNEILYATRDTFFSDTGFHLPPNTDPFAQVCLEYRIALRNDLQEIGPTCTNARIAFLPETYVRTWFEHQVKYPDPDPNCDTATINDIVRLSVTARNLTRSLVSLAWYDPFKKKTIKTIDAGGLSRKELSSTIEYAFDTIGINRPFVTVIDDAGKKWYDTIPVKIVADPPVVGAGKDTGVLISDTVRLHGTATQRFGTIDKWEWKIGSGTWRETPGPEIEFIAPSTEGICICSLAVTDDDWNRVTDAVRLITADTAQSVAAGGQHSLFLKTDGSLWACGNNNTGQLGYCGTGSSKTPTRVMSDIREISAGGKYSLILTIDGVLWTCGANEYGQLGDGTFNFHCTPKPVMDSVRSIASFDSHSLILKKNGTLLACGWNISGQLGEGTTETRNVPVVVMSDVRSMAAGLYHSLFLKTDSTAWACGENGGGQLGDGTTEDRLTPVKVMSGVQSVASGSWNSFFLTTDGTLWACGNNGYGQLGDGTCERRLTPVEVMTDVRSMAAGPYHSLILRNDGVLLLCGLNPSEYSGNVATAGKRFTPVPVMTDVRSMAAGLLYSLVVKTDGTAWACGANGAGQLGDGSGIDRSQWVCIFPPQY